MKKLLVATLAGSAALLACTAANALTFTYSGHVDFYTVQTGGWYEIDVWGAQGGQPPLGGLGAMVGGSVHLDAGQVLDVLVGGQGESGANAASGGGGGSFVFLPSQLLLAAGGGGGGGYGSGAGGPGLAGTAGGGAGGGVNGQGGAAAGDRFGAAGGGGGWLTGGQSGTTGVYGQGGIPLGPGGWTHGCVSPSGYLECVDGPSGGFGGGGGGSWNDGGGGGGYSDGAGAGGSVGYNTLSTGGGGGGSYIGNGFSNTVALSGVRSANGLVTIDFLPLAVPVPEPATWAMMLLGFFGLGSLLRRRRQTALRGPTP